jgi:hypothetical protein
MFLFVSEHYRIFDLIIKIKKAVSKVKQPHSIMNNSQLHFVISSRPINPGTLFPVDLK